MSLREFTDAYIECALWAENTGEDQNYTALCDTDHEVAPETFDRFRLDCAKFYSDNWETIEASGVSFQNAGHDFWLTRSGHGCGFWDGDYPEPQATQLTKASKAFGNCELYVGDDKLIYIF